MKDKQYYLLFLLLIIPSIFFGCQTLSFRGQTGFLIDNRSSRDIRIESLKKISFTDRTTIPWERSYQYYIHKIDAKLIPSGQKKRLNITDGYYGIEICDGKFCTYTNFHFKKVILLMIEDEMGKRRISYKFIN